LADGLEAIFGAGNHDLHSLAEGLKNSGVARPSKRSGPWTTEVLLEEVSGINMSLDDAYRRQQMVGRTGVGRADAKSGSLEVGLLGHWYPVAKTSEVSAENPTAVTALGRRLVLWRGVNDTIHCVEDRCPHRGAPLSRGIVTGELLACHYHGMSLSGDGTIARVPAMPGCALEGRKAIDAYAAIERNDAVFVYFPSPARPVPTPLTLPDEFDSPEWTTFLCAAAWNCNYLYVLDNIVDPMHGIYLHSDTFTLSGGLREDLVDVDRTKVGFVIRRRGQQGQNLDWTEFVAEGGAMFGRVEVPYPPAGGPGGMMRVLAFVVPIDTEWCRIFFWRSRKVSGLGREIWRFLYRATFEPRHWYVLEQDRVMIEQIPSDARDNEMLYQHDLGIGHLRRLLRHRHAEQSVTAAQPAPR